MQKTLAQAVRETNLEQHSKSPHSQTSSLSLPNALTLPMRKLKLKEVSRFSNITQLLTAGSKTRTIVRAPGGN